MPIIGTIGRRAPSVRLLIGGIYALLTLGAITMVYPFLLMLAGSTRSAVDTAETGIVPAFLVNDGALYRKHVEGLFNESLVMLRAAYDTNAVSFRDATPPGADADRRVALWNAFLDARRPPADTYACGYLYAPVSRGTQAATLRAFARELSARNGGSIAAVNDALGTDYPGWNAFYVLPADFLQRSARPRHDAAARAFAPFKRRQPRGLCYYFSPEGFFKRSYLAAQYTRDITAYNRAHGTAFRSWNDVHLDRRLPAAPGHTDRERDDWVDFMRNVLNVLWIRCDADAAPAYREYLRARYGTIATLNRRYGTAHDSFAAIPPVVAPPPAGIALSDWEAFLQGWRDPATGRLMELPAEYLHVDGIDFMYRDYLRTRFADARDGAALTRLNAALGTSYTSWLAVKPPQREAHAAWFRAHRGALRRELAFRNYIAVFNYIVLHGRGVLNTVIYCTLAVLAALIVNPLAAYALSRYRPPSTYRILLFLMLTMAFPPMVTQIPVFLMLREFKLLNTFWALVLPGLANGYSIFLLKGFFDSLPRELYESAAIDGAGELRIFHQITMSLSKPILAVTALQAFTLAYSNFMMALLICQDEKMWTLMPWLYQLQQDSGPGVVMASLIVAAVPTFLIFVFCQKIIMRGIVVPVEK